MLLIGLAFIQSPGLLVADTKFDLVASPWSFLGRAVHLWDPDGALGQLQNQAYGYLWPMGPFFALGDVVGLDGWVVQRLWMAVVLCVGFVGAACLARATGVRSDAATLIAAFAYATSPRILSTIGPISIEAWPSAVAPWVLLPLVIGAERGSPRRAAALSAVAVAMVGGVNAAATLAVLPLGAVWLLTRAPGARRRSMMLWWPIFTVLGTLWWLVPLFVMGAYSPPFLGFIESASVTTFPTTLFDALRGTSAWVPYVDSSWQGGAETVSHGYLALNSGLVLMLGVVGMAMRDSPHRQFLVVSVIVGLCLVTLGHQGNVQGWFAEPISRTLDGALAPIRNVHKFDPVVRLPMVLGLAWLLEIETRKSVGRRFSFPGVTASLSTAAPIAMLAFIAVVGAAVPALAGRLAPTPGLIETPSYWADTAHWLDTEAADGAALLAPGSSFGEYLWGSPRDEPMQYLGTSRWAVRNAIPLTPPGNIRMLDAVEERFNQGVGSPGLARYLARSGIRFVVVRNDLAPSGDVPEPELVRQALSDSPGLVLTKTFGPEVGGEAFLETDEGRVLINGGRQSERRAIEIYEVQGSVDQAVTAQGLPTVVGGPEDVLSLLDHDLVGDGPTELAADRAARETDLIQSSALVLTDGMLDRERFFGRVHDGSSSVRTPGDERRSGNPVVDFELPGANRWRTRAQLRGASQISASSSMADSNAWGGAEKGALPYAAVDDDPSSTWKSGQNDSGADWWQVDLEQPLQLDSITITTGDSVTPGTPLLVQTDNENLRVDSSGSGVVEVPLSAGEVSRIRVSEDVATQDQLELADVAWDGRDVHRSLVTPRIPDTWGAPQTVLLRALGDGRTGCVTIDGRVPCIQGSERAAEEPRSMERVVELPEAATYQADLMAVPRGGDALAALLQQGQLVSSTGSTTGVPDARASGIAAIDGDLGTTWVAARDDLRPTLSLNFLKKRRMTGVTIAVAAAAPVERPTKVKLIWPNGQREVELDDDGQAEFEPIRTDQLQIRILETANAASVDRAGNGSSLPTGMTELRLDGVPQGAGRPSDRPRSFGCGSGPTLTVNGSVTRTEVVAAPAELFAMRTVPVSFCGGDRAGRVDLGAGKNIVRISGSDYLAPESLELREGTSNEDDLVGSVAMESGGPSSATFRPSDAGDVLNWRQNTNVGWLARQSGRELRPLVLDGWQQGWRLDDASSVEASYTPDSRFRLGLGAGAILFLALLGSVVFRRRWGGVRLSALGPRTTSTAVMIAGGLFAGGVLGGWIGLVMAGLGATVSLGLQWPRVRELAPWATGALAAAASFPYFLRPWGSATGWAGDQAWPHYLVLVALGALCAVVASDGRPRFFRRMNGRSTQR